MAAAPAAPVLLTPTQGAVNVLSPVHLSWQAVTGATYYAAQVSTVESFATVVATMSTLDTGLDVPGLAKGTRYFWRVLARNGDGRSPYSAARGFTTSTTAVPVAPVLQSPADGAVAVPRPVRLTWLPVTGAETYGVQVSTVENFATVVFTKGGSFTAVEVPELAKNTRYFWRVLARNAGGYSPWSPVWRFTTANVDPPAAPLLYVPANGAVNVPLTARLAWQPPAGVVDYVVFVATSEAFTSLAYGNTLTTPWVDVPGLAKGTTYYWKVVARNAGGASPWSAVWRFATTSAQAPVAPVLLAPANGAVGVTLPPRLYWQAVSGATEYGVQVSTVETFATTVLSRSTTGTGLEVPGLALNTLYFWRVVAKNGAGVSPWSPTWHFTTTAGDRPAVPVLYAPARAAVNVPTNTRLVWLAAARATGYHIQVSTTTDFSRVVWEGTAPGTSDGVSPLGLLANTTYIWRVRAANAAGLSDWSTLWYFTTAPAAPPAGS
ncbi:MAG: hypothetical protein HZB16_01505 [Armatimonadetes bacterium]|nr:hypothetical protein [Armatimonadota bacterium]